MFKSKGVVLRSLCMAKGYFYSINNAVGFKRLSDSVTTWSKSPTGVVKINTDGARIDSDNCKEAADLINSGTDFLPCLELLKDIQQHLCKRHWSIHIQHIPRGVNRVANFIAKQVLRYSYGFYMSEEPMEEMIQMLEQDARGPITSVLSYGF
ncbi:hypothetical protein J1N35_019270 [Gossypium stocksii]|uniref:RNase H type-1 domain-containing protein n=1 Tax=Gossypium stocksii TaxID=47602 RepID=A0A9D3VSV4_9ROSI|nr:hypothetical protein J1N35_019270 [Gossypium stocksii]